MQKPKKKAFTLIELMVVLAVLSILAALLAPKANSYIIRAKRTGIEQNKSLLESLARYEYTRASSVATSEDDRVAKTFQVLSKNKDLLDMKNPINEVQQGIGLIKGSTFVNTNKAAYVFTDNPVASTIPDGVAYVVLKTGLVTSNVGMNGDYENADTDTGGDTTPPVVDGGDTAPPSGESTKPPTDEAVTLEDQVIMVSNGVLFIKDGYIYASGATTVPILGLHMSTPQKIMSAKGVKQVTAAGDNLFIVKHDGTAYHYGADVYGESGTTQKGSQTWNSSDNSYTSNPKISLNEKLIPTDIDALYPGHYSLIASYKNGMVTATGREYNTNILGLGNDSAYYTYSRLSIDNIKGVAGDSNAAVYLLENGDVWGSSINSYTLGTYISSNTTGPLKKLPIDNVRQVSGNNTTMGYLKEDGTVYYGGYIDTGYTITFGKLPITNVKKIAVGDKYILMLKEDNTLWFTGSNATGVGGVGAASIGASTVTKVDIGNVVDVQAKGAGACVVLDNGDIYFTGKRVDTALGYDVTKWTLSPSINFRK